MREDPQQEIASFRKPLLAGTIHNENQTVGTQEKMVPRAHEACVSAEVPESKSLPMPAVHRFMIVPDGRMGSYGFPEMQSIEKGGFASGVETYQKQNKWAYREFRLTCVSTFLLLSFFNPTFTPTFWLLASDPGEC